LHPIKLQPLSFISKNKKRPAILQVFFHF